MFSIVVKAIRHRVLLFSYFTGGQMAKKGFRKRPKVALLIEMSNAYSRGILRGISAYVHENRPWSIYLAEFSRGGLDPYWIRAWHGDGIIARIETEAMARTIKTLGLPTVDVSAARLLPKLPYVETDDAAIAILAAEHFLACGFKHFGFCGADFNWSRLRCRHFRAFCDEKKTDCHVCPLPENARGLTQEQELECIKKWIRTLPKPAAVMAAYDVRGQHVIEACRSEGILVPEQIAVVGVDNDELLCHLCNPPMTSIIPDTYRTGYVAATYLEQLMQGKAIEQRTTLIKPLGIALRKSSDITAIEDPIVGQAMNFIHERACEYMTVSDLLSLTNLSRRVFERRFKQCIGHTPHEEIMRVRISRIKSLLLETDLSLDAIAKRAGFDYDSYMSSVFKQYTGVSPGAFRKQHRESKP